MKLYKMNGLGNKFYILDYRETENLDISYDDTMSICNGRVADYDQLIVMLFRRNCDCYMKIFNIDGSEASACGNASRCVAKIIAKEKELGREISIETVNRTIFVNKLGDSYQVRMGCAWTDWNRIPLSKELDASQVSLLDEAKFGKGFCVNVGNPHIVFFVKDIDQVDLESDVSHLETYPLFKEGVNINVAEIVSDTNIKAKTWERGAGATLACGTGACATFYAANQRGLVGRFAQLQLPGGSLEISLNDSSEILMTGDANLEEELTI